MDSWDAVIAAALATTLLIPVVFFSRRIFKPGPMFDPERFARFLIAEIRIQNRGELPPDDVERSRKMFLARYPDAESVFDAALQNIQPQR